MWDTSTAAEWIWIHNSDLMDMGHIKRGLMDMGHTKRGVMDVGSVKAHINYSPLDAVHINSRSK